MSKVRVQVFSIGRAMFVQTTLAGRDPMVWGPYATLAEATRVHDEFVATFKAALEARGYVPRIESERSPAVDLMVEKERN